VVVSTNWSVRRNRRHDWKEGPFALAEKWKKNQRDKSDALQDDGYCDGTLLDATRAFLRLRIAFDEAVAE
jgi:hypothetical protein